MDKQLLKELKAKVQGLALQNITVDQAVEKLKEIYYDTCRDKDIPYSKYLEVAALIAILKALHIEV